MRPHHFIFNRDWYETLRRQSAVRGIQEGIQEAERFRTSGIAGPHRERGPERTPGQVKLATTSRVKSIMRHYLPLAKEEEAEIWARQRAMKQQDDPSIIVPDEERVEDAGLNYEEAPAPVASKAPTEEGYGDRMSTNIVPITLRESPWQNLASEIVIGKDILELLSSSMYVDPMTIYREYVQNAADSIDEARGTGELGQRERARSRSASTPPAEM